MYKNQILNLCYEFLKTNYTIKEFAELNNIDSSTLYKRFKKLPEFEKNLVKEHNLKIQFNRKHVRYKREKYAYFIMERSKLKKLTDVARELNINYSTLTSHLDLLRKRHHMLYEDYHKLWLKRNGK